MNFWLVKNVQKCYNCINPSSSTVKTFYTMLHEKYYGSSTVNHRFTGRLSMYLSRFVKLTPPRGPVKYFAR